MAFTRISNSHPRRTLLTLATLFTLLTLLLTGCSVVKKTASIPVKTVEAVVPVSKPAQSDPAAVQAMVQRYADDFDGQISAGLHDYIVRTRSPEARAQALVWRINLGSSSMAIATGANPTANLVDFIALASLTRSFVERRATNVLPPGSLDLLLKNCRVLETNAWKLADGILSPAQQNEFRTAIVPWLAQNADEDMGFFRRPQDLSPQIRGTGPQETRSGSVFSVIGLDPTAGLDPAVREVARSRLFAERALYALQRMPSLIRLQSELLSQQILRQDQVSNSIASVDRLSRSVESISQTTAALPDRITAERKAILDALDAQEGKLRDLSAEVTRTLAAGDRMSTSLNTTITSFNGLMKRFGVGEPSTSPPDTNSPPFNILDYARTAEQITEMSRQLDALIKDTTGTLDAPALDKRIADLNAIVSRAHADAKSVLNHAFLLAAALIVLAFACALIYRRLAPRVANFPPNRPPGAGS